MSQIDILQAFDESSTAMSAADVIARTGLPRSTVFRGLRSLVGSGLLHQERGTRKYTLGPRVLQLGMAARRQLSAEELVAVPLLQLLQQTQETVTFSILDIPWRVCTYVLEAPSDIRSVAQVGARYPLHLGSAGKVILALLPVDLATSILEGEGLSQSDIDDLLRQLSAIRERGYAITEGERVPGAAAIAAPVFVGRQVFGSVAMTGPADRVREELPRHSPAVVDAARTISERLSARPESGKRKDRKELQNASHPDGAMTDPIA